MRRQNRRSDRVRDVDIFSLVAGPDRPQPARGQTPDVVLLHGLGVSNRYLWPSVRLLADEFRVWAPDLPGVGRSSRAPRRLSLDSLADGVEEWMGQVGVRRATVVGHSLGCTLAAALAARHPSRVRAVVLASPAPDPGQRPLLRQAWRLLLDAPRERPLMMLTALGDYATVGPRWVVRAITEARRADLTGDLERIAQPALVLCGSRDPLVSRPWAETLVEALPRADLVVLPAAPHGLPCTSAEAFTAEVRAFARQHTEAADRRFE